MLASQPWGFFPFIRLCPGIPPSQCLTPYNNDIRIVSIARARADADFSLFPVLVLGLFSILRRRTMDAACYAAN